MPDALAELQAQIGPGFQHTTLLARLSKRHGNEGDVQNLGGDLLKQFEGVVQNEEETSLSLL